MTAQRRARRRRRRGPRPAARHSQSGTAPGPRWPISGLRAAANRGAREAGAQLDAAGHGSVGLRRVPPRSDPPPAGALCLSRGNRGRGSTPVALGLPACVMGRGRAPPDPETGVSSACTVKRLLCARSASGGRWAGVREPALGGHFEQGSLAGLPSPPGLASRALPRAEVTRTVRTPTVCPLVLSAWGGEPSSSLTPRTCCSPEGEHSTRMRMTLSVPIRFGSLWLPARNGLWDGAEAGHQEEVTMIAQHPRKTVTPIGAGRLSKAVDDRSKLELTHGSY
ncbi:uncharacterized protein LOC116594826 [Mustela erminea]|uniref:uncharacterized protein LOC116594826 n=1 Tax=Mustela erminea TaxID=36723 RepID=UPI0013876172|nr:uncharacterized protein LOC116594826 [Mustela erminea]